MTMAPPARLTSALLARKGHALPTCGFAQSRLGLVPPQPAAAKTKPQRGGTPAARASLSADLIRRSAPKPSRHPDHAEQARVAFTIRLDRKRYTRLKSLAERRGRSRQGILIEALDAYLHACAADCAGSPARRRPGKD
jgi:hypothetical protein